MDGIQRDASGREGSTALAPRQQAFLSGIGCRKDGLRCQDMVWPGTWHSTSRALCTTHPHQLLTLLPGASSLPAWTGFCTLLRMSRLPHIMHKDIKLPVQSLAKAILLLNVALR